MLSVYVNICAPYLCKVAAVTVTQLSLAVCNGVQNKKNCSRVSSFLLSLRGHAFRCQRVSQGVVTSW